MISLRTLALLFCSCAPLACATASGTSAPLPAGHPASAEAPEVPIEDPSALLRAEPGSLEPAAPADAQESAPAGAYVCPMHAEVSADEPGRCHKCGMKLVPREGLRDEERSDAG